MATLPASIGVVQSLAGGNGASFASDILALPNSLQRPGLLVIDSTAGTTITAAIQGSLDGANWYSIPYATAAAPQTPAVAALTITTTTLTFIHLLAFAFLFLRVNFTANTGMTINGVKVLI